ncbi:uncharacterized protein FOMMEDRAFT_117379 [Fomitiporia mediterranea MF3/22]|uniref:uncharacterized protein n=1 Tax=Fomitiporia mediterranea (strain MF3/22) TaxID=694068 RepID=UPI0004409AB9|nr:uncharacterized protein FOMMEDRAFT_117379 [Fomitiporia mediterranea MF3/22]EJD06530.1 hypothetical protein FOMMEDRAFT_117379 [Fomitiporia mediterranea MF3/22]
MPISIDASKHLVKAVTVFSSSKAEVVRTFTVDLEEGQNELSITSLPSCMDTDSARVTGLGDAVLFDVVCTVIDARDMPPSSDGDALRALERRREVLEGEKSLRGRAADIMVQYGRSMNAEYTTPDVVTSFVDTLVKRGANSLDEAKVYDEQLAELDKEIEKEKRRLQKERQKPAARGRVTAVIMAKRARKIEVTLTYMVSNASWSPSYDLRAITEDGKPSRTVSLHYRASIQQNTGEDWRDTAVSVSTATPGTWSSIPSRRAMKISPGQNTVFASKSIGAMKASAPVQRQVMQQQQQVTFGNSATNNANTSSGLFGRAPLPPPPPGSAPAPPPAATMAFGGARRRSAHAAPGPTGAAEVVDDWQPVETFVETVQEPEDVVASDNDDAAWGETKTIVTESAVASSFRIDGDCTIPSELTAHKVAIALLSFDAKVNYIAVPRSAPMSFLQCEVKNTSQYRLLPGSVNVFLDNSPVSKTNIFDINPEEVFKCTLGPDPALRIKCTRMPPVVTTSGSMYVAQTKITTYKICTTVQNGHSFPVKGLQVRDTAPNTGEAAENKEIKVVIKLPEGLAEAAPNAIVDVPKASVPGKSSVKVRWEPTGGAKEGMYVWLVDLGPGEEVKLEAEYEVRAPENYVWHMREEHFN